MRICELKEKEVDQCMQRKASRLYRRCGDQHMYRRNRGDRNTRTGENMRIFRDRL